jgi:hypothetical protein
LFLRNDSEGGFALAELHAKALYATHGSVADALLLQRSISSAIFLIRRAHAEYITKQIYLDMF